MSPITLRRPSGSVVFVAVVLFLAGGGEQARRLDDGNFQLAVPILLIVSGASLVTKAVV
ncbi:MAG TPA: hypothetical protein VN808_18200 [Stellaceae bacterium]|nr:hypothetical protein [Stellaceae bacterium]